jgi:prefoldin subunit 5
MRASSSVIADISSSLNQFSSNAEKGTKEISELQAAIKSINTTDKDIQDLLNNFGTLSTNAEAAE